MSFSVDEDKRLIVDDSGNPWSIEQFKALLLSDERVDMTMMTQRLILFDFDFDKLVEFYDS